MIELAIHPLRSLSRKRRRRYPGPFAAIEKFAITTARSRSRIFAARTARQIPGKRIEGLDLSTNSGAFLGLVPRTQGSAISILEIATTPAAPSTSNARRRLGPRERARAGEAKWAPVRRENRLKSKSSAPEENNRGDETAAIAVPDRPQGRNSRAIVASRTSTVVTATLFGALLTDRRGALRSDVSPFRDCGY